MPQIRADVALTEAVVFIDGEQKTISADSYDPEQHGHLTCFCPDCLKKGHELPVRFVPEQTRNITFAKLDADTHSFMGQVERDYILPARFAALPGRGGHQCDIVQKRNLKSLAHRALATRADNGIYVFDLRIPYAGFNGKDFKGFLSQAFGRHRLQVKDSAQRTDPDQSGLHSAEELADFFLNLRYDPEFMMMQRFWDGRTVRTAHDVLKDDLGVLVQDLYKDDLGPQALVYRAIGNRGKWREFAEKLSRRQGMIIPGQAASIAHQGTKIRPSVALEFAERALYDRAVEILNREGVRKSSPMLVYAPVEMDRERYDETPVKVRTGAQRLSGLKQGIPLYMRVVDERQMANWDAQAELDKVHADRVQGVFPGM